MVANEVEGRAEALRRIAACRTARAEELDLGGLQLTALDGELLAALCQLGWLRRLFFGLSAEVRGKQQVEWLDLALNRNRLRDLPASIANLVNLTSLDLTYNDIEAEGVQALKGLTGLTSLDLSGNRIGDEGVQALKGLVNLTSLGLAENGIEDVSPLASLRNLRSIDLSGSHLDHDVPAFWMLPSLQQAILHEASLPGVPVEILSEDSSDNCLDRLRAHLRIRFTPAFDLF